MFLRAPVAVLTLLLAALGSSLTAVVAPAPAMSAGTHCVTKKEYKRVHNGMTMRKVHRIFDTHGTLLFANPGAVHNSAREYKSCSAFAAAAGDRVQIQYNNYATNGGPQRVVYKQTY